MIITVLSWIVFGLLAGVIARSLLPGTPSLGFVATSALGIFGAFVGCYVMSLALGIPVLEFRPIALVGSLLGALFMLRLSNVASRNATP